ncbi:CBS domain-containing protein [Amycolatopsis sp. NPDC021455]|uniref:CBS domain-containing protein n=1 Tax=Amycolatopsis sp. NPDC021455 TaxID=3154901 RepID=UPI0033FE8513
MRPGPAVPARTGVHELASHMAELSARSLPVAEDGLLVGIVTASDVLRALARTREHSRTTAR